MHRNTLGLRAQGLHVVPGQSVGALVALTCEFPEEALAFQTPSDSRPAIKGSKGSRMLGRFFLGQYSSKAVRSRRFRTVLRPMPAISLICLTGRPSRFIR